ncbi:hypothetical protein V8C34DRAFT_320831 [Trichoderma compactum]
MSWKRSRGEFCDGGPPDGARVVDEDVEAAANYPKDTFLATFESLFKAFWTPPNVNLIPEENPRAVLQGATEKPGKSGSKKLFTEEEVEKIMKARGGMKDVLMATTQRAVDQGAFGAPWIWVTNAKGEQEPCFGSDR